MSPGPLLSPHGGRFSLFLCDAAIEIGCVRPWEAPAVRNGHGCDSKVDHGENLQTIQIRAEVRCSRLNLAVPFPVIARSAQSELPLRAFATRQSSGKSGIASAVFYPMGMKRTVTEKHVLAAGLPRREDSMRDRPYALLAMTGARFRLYPGGSLCTSFGPHPRCA